MKKRMMWSTLLLAVLTALTYLGWPSLINAILPAGSRPGQIRFPVESVTADQFETTATALKSEFKTLNFKHIDRFRQAGIRAYDGPGTCMRCHPTVAVTIVGTSRKKTVDLLADVTSSAHYRFFTKRHPNVWGFNGKLADNFAMGKIDRPCPKPGSFAFTAWAELVERKDKPVLSEGCGQCHIGGQYQAPLGELMPGYRTMDSEKEAIDCLICHSAGYDMNRKQVVQDAPGFNRWDQDRSMKAAMSVTRTTAQTCLRCHQHNMGGDFYVDPADPSYMQSLRNAGRERPRVLHPGSKRGTPFSPSWDVHAALGMNCTECHATEGHAIARGQHTTTLMANDLPDVAVACENCHPTAPHVAGNPRAADLNRHTARLACQICHIPSLHPDNATMRDFAVPTYEAEAGIYIYSDIRKDTLPGKGIVYAWWNGDGTFLGNPIGDNPNGLGLYCFYKLQHKWPEFSNFNYDAWYESVMRPIARKKPSKLYAMKLYNGRQHIDLQNMGPFGGMFVPYNLPTYFTTGNPGRAGQVELAKPMMGMMYGVMFKYYLMDKFMSFMGTGWNTGAYDDVRAMRKVEPRWLPTDALMEISHAIRREGALTCRNCHGAAGVMDWRELGYSEQEAARLSTVPVDK